ncbi:UNVERIFIED_CONTAM: hypothetical protein PYX00_010040 [Menopon gallinae]|uniref:Nuclear protein MDM1 n=1 Tax=Menopon gallinae TaxID=328185 RepID=A0AAW2HDT7_9NEOP
MIGTFWSLCRACPSVPVDKLHSEYRSTYRWHEYTGPRQEIIRKAPQNSGTGYINEPPLHRRRKHPELAYRAHDILAAIDRRTDNPLDKAYIFDRARSEERWGGARHKSSRRSKSEGPPIDQSSYQLIYTRPANVANKYTSQISNPSYINDENVAPPKANAADGESNNPGQALKQEPKNKSSEYKLQYSWPTPTKVLNNRIGEIHSQHIPRKSISMNGIKNKGTPIQETVPVHKKIALKNQSDIGVLRSLKPNADVENANTDDTKNEDHDRNEFKSEYKKNFQPFSKYNFDENKGVFEERPNTVDSLQNTVTEMDSPSSWYKEVVLLRKKANQYRHRGWGTELVSDHIAQLYNDQILVWEQVSRRSTLSALALASTIIDKDRSSRAAAKDEKENRKNSPTKSLVRVRSAKATHDSSADRITKDNVEKKNVKNKLAKKQTELSPNKGNTRSKKTSVERTSPNRISRISASSVPPNTHRASNQGSEKPKRRPRPTSLVTSVPPGSKISFAETKKKDGTDEITGEDVPEFPVVIDEQIVKSPPEPTRVKSPEQIVMRSPEPVNWTVPLDTGKTFTVTQNVREGDVGPRSFSEARAWTPNIVPPPASVSAPTQLLELGKVNIPG